MNRNVLFVAMVAILVLLWGCQTYQSRAIQVSIEASTIPDQAYEVTVYKRFLSNSYAILFDIPDDGKEVYMKYTSFTERIGKDSPRRYVGEFEKRIKFYKTIRIGDEDGTVRGYLMISGDLRYWVNSAEERITVGIESEPMYR